jgi:hypothetical protein
MKKALSILVLLLLVSSLSFSQFAPAKGKMTLGPALELSLPIGNFSDIAGFGFGATARFEYGLDQNLALTGNIGYLTWTGVSFEEFGLGYDISSHAIPIVAGVKYGFSKGWFVSGEIGLYNLTETWDFTGTPVPGYPSDLYNLPSHSSTEFMLAPGLGYQHGPIEGLFRFYVVDTNLMNFSLMVAYNFPLN